MTIDFGGGTQKGCEEKPNTTSGPHCEAEEGAWGSGTAPHRFHVSGSGRDTWSIWVSFCWDPFVWWLSKEQLEEKPTPMFLEGPTHPRFALWGLRVWPWCRPKPPAPSNQLSCERSKINQQGKTQRRTCPAACCCREQPTPAFWGEPTCAVRRSDVRSQSRSSSHRGGRKPAMLLDILLQPFVLG